MKTTITPSMPCSSASASDPAMQTHLKLPLFFNKLLGMEATSSPLQTRQRKRERDIEPVEMKMALKQSPPFSTRIHNILTYGLSGREAPRQGSRWAEEDRAAAKHFTSMPSFRPVNTRGTHANVAAGPSGITHDPTKKRMLYSRWEAWAREQDNSPHQYGVSPARARPQVGAHYQAVGKMKECMEKGLPWLDLSRLSLNTLPDNLPPHITHLDISRNKLTEIPDTLPQNLTSLTATDNPLSKPPRILPHGMIGLDLDRTTLRALPDYLPRKLAYLFVANNKLTTLPASMFRLDSEAAIHAEDNAFSQVTLEILNKHASNPAYQGPHIFYSLEKRVYVVAKKG